MSNNPYFSWSREDLKEEIRVEKQQRQELLDEIAREKAIIRDMRPQTEGYFLVDGDIYSNRAVTLANRANYYAKINTDRATRAYEELSRLTDNPDYLIEAVQQPWRLETRERTFQALPQKAMREGKIERLQREVAQIEAELKKKDEAWKRPVTPPYMLIEFVKFWEIKEDVIRRSKRKKETPRIRFEVRSTWTIPWNSIEAEPRNNRWVPTKIDDKVVDYVDEVFWDVIDQWGGAEIDFKYYSDSEVVVAGSEEKGTTEKFNSLPDFKITKYINDVPVQNWDWRIRISEERM